jgi:putative ABC transport system permease protein
MTPIKLVWKELWQRPTAMVTCLMAISLGIASLVAIRSVTIYSEQAVAGELQALGANVLLLPKGVTLNDYYAADSHGATLPEEMATELALANLQGVEHIAPKLSAQVELNGKSIHLTGILPQSDFESKAMWQSAQLFSNKHEGCSKRAAIVDDKRPPSESLAKGRFVHDLAKDELIAGADVAHELKIKAGDSLQMFGESFRVAGVMPATGTTDDGRLFAHLHTVQRLIKHGENVNVIEIMACCEDAAGGLIHQLTELFPDAKVVTITQVVDTQVAVNRLMNRLSYLFFAILLLVGVASIAGTMYANVTERRREIGTMMALGAAPSLIAVLFLGKALVIGVSGGILGYVTGTALAVCTGPQWAGISVYPIPSLAPIAVALAALVALVASYPPARRAAMVDPCLCFREV